MMSLRIFGLLRVLGPYPRHLNGIASRSFTRQFFVEGLTTSVNGECLFGERVPGGDHGTNRRFLTLLGTRALIKAVPV